MWPSALRTFLTVSVVLVFLLMPVLSLWPALSGPFLFDDHPNLKALTVLEGDISLRSLIAYLSENAAGPTGRPLSMLTFLLNDIYWPSDPRSFKYTNLLLHVLNGLLVLWLAIGILRQWAGHFGDKHCIIAIVIAS